MEDVRGPLNRIVTKVPLPGRDVSDLGPDEYLYFDRSRVLKKAAAEVSTRLGVDLPWAPLDLSILEYDPERGTESGAAREHTFCRRQGRCIFGCLPGARETLDRSLFDHVLSSPDAGATLLPMAEVTGLRRIDGGYEVSFRDHRRGGEEKRVTAASVFLAAGTLGTTEVLLRAQEQETLALSDRLGRGFSTNCDFGAFIVDTAQPVNSAEGPINTCGVRAVVDGMHFTLEDTGIPSMVAPTIATSIRLIDTFVRRRLFRGKLRLTWLAQSLREPQNDPPQPAGHVRPPDVRTEAETVANIFLFHVMGQDDASGRLTLRDGKLDLRWETSVLEQPTYRKAREPLQGVRERHGGTLRAYGRGAAAAAEADDHPSARRLRNRPDARCRSRRRARSRLRRPRLDGHGRPRGAVRRRRLVDAGGARRQSDAHHLGAGAEGGHCSSGTGTSGRGNP